MSLMFFGAQSWRAVSLPTVTLTGGRHEGRHCSGSRHVCRGMWRAEPHGQHARRFAGRRHGGRAQGPGRGHRHRADARARRRPEGRVGGRRHGRDGRGGQRALPPRSVRRDLGRERGKGARREPVARLLQRDQVRAAHAGHRLFQGTTSVTSPATLRCITRNSTRRFFSRPWRVAFVAMGWFGPNPCATIRLAATPRRISAPTTASARACESARFLAVPPMLSVCPCTSMRTTSGWFFSTRAIWFSRRADRDWISVFPGAKYTLSRMSMRFSWMETICLSARGQIVSIHENRIDILDKVYFAPGKTLIQSRSARLLNQIARVLKNHPEVVRIDVQGHTDSIGGTARNLALSQARAEAVVGALIRRGVAANRMVAHGFGPNQPIATNATRQGREKNRRVEFRVMQRRVAGEVTDVVP